MNFKPFFDEKFSVEITINFGGNLFIAYKISNYRQRKAAQTAAA